MSERGPGRRAARRGKPQRRGSALMTALLVGSILVVLLGAMLGLFVLDYAEARVRQDAIQATWNARSGLERYLATGTLPAPDAKSGIRAVGVRPGDATQQCLVQPDPERGAIVFEGVAGRAHRRLRVPLDHPERAVEVLP